MLILPISFILCVLFSRCYKNRDGYNNYNKANCFRYSSGDGKANNLLDIFQIKENIVMKMKSTLFFFLSLATMCSSCYAPKTCSSENADCIIPQKAVTTFLSDSVSNTVFDASCVNIYKLAERRDSVKYSPDSLILGYAVVEKYQSICRDLTSALQFILSDKKTYLMSEYYPLAPFLPGYYIEFVQGDIKCGMLISISGGLCRLYFGEKLLKEFKYTQERLITYFLFLITKDERLEAILELQTR